MDEYFLKLNKVKKVSTMPKNVFILGGEQTDFQRNWTKEGKKILSMIREIVEDAFNDSKIDFEDIRKLNKKNRVAFYVGNFDAEQYANQGHLGAFLTEVDSSFYGIPGARFEAACASGSVAIDAAYTKIYADQYDLVIVLGVEMMKTVSSVIGAQFLGTAAFYEKEAKDIDFPFPKLFGKLADILFQRSDISEERFLKALAEISAKNYSNAKRNPKAQTRSWFANSALTNSRNSKYNVRVGGKLCVTDCSQITDGAALLFLASESFAKRFAQKRNIKIQSIPVIKGWGHRTAPLLFEEKILESTGKKFVLPWTKQAIDDAYLRAEMQAEMIDVIETHDCFTSSEYAAISAFGITEPGKEYEAIESGLVMIDGKIPINPSGGLIGVGHPVGASGVRMMLDLYKQVAGKAGEYQIPGVENGAMLNIGGTATTNYAFVVGNNDQ